MKFIWFIVEIEQEKFIGEKKNYFNYKYHVHWIYRRGRNNNVKKKCIGTYCFHKLKNFESIFWWFPGGINWKLRYWKTKTKKHFVFKNKMIMNYCVFAQIYCYTNRYIMLWLVILSLCHTKRLQPNALVAVYNFHHWYTIKNIIHTQRLNLGQNFLSYSFVYRWIFILFT